MTRTEAIEGLSDGRWRVRRSAAFWILRRGSADDLRAVLPLLHDPKSRVRQVATHVIGAAGELAAARIDALPLLMERALEDESLRVRRHAVLLLAIRHAHPHLEGFFQRLLDQERDAKLHRNAGIGLFLSRQKSLEAAPC